jgi:hypothetical protein
MRTTPCAVDMRKVTCLNDAALTMLAHLHLVLQQCPSHATGPSRCSHALVATAALQTRAEAPAGPSLLQVIIRCVIDIGFM